MREGDGTNVAPEPIGRHPGGAGAAGFTLVELLLVVVIVSLLAGLAIPNLQRATTKARAAEAIGHLHAVEVALHNYVADHHAWPDEAAVGATPSGLEPYLPDNFDFSPEGYEVDYDNLLGNEGGFVGLTVVTQETELGLAMVDLLGSNTWTNGTNRFTWVIEWAD